MWLPPPPAAGYVAVRLAGEVKMSRFFFHLCSTRAWCVWLGVPHSHLCRFRFRKPRHHTCPRRLPPAADAILSPTLTANKQRWRRRRMARWERMEGSSSVRGEGGVKRDTHRRREGFCRWTRMPQAGKRSAPTLLATGREGAAERPFVHVGWFGMPKQSWRRGRGNLMLMVLLMVAVPNSRV